MNNLNSRCVVLSSSYFLKTKEIVTMCFIGLFFGKNSISIDFFCEIDNILPDAGVSSLIFLNSKANKEIFRLYGRLAGFL